MQIILKKPVDLTTEEEIMFNMILGRGGRLRSSKPKVEANNPLTGKAAYVWRIVCFYLGNNRQDSCIPVSADYDLPAIASKDEWTCYSEDNSFESHKLSEVLPLNANSTKYSDAACPIHANQSHHCYHSTRRGKRCSKEARIMAKELEDSIVTKILVANRGNEPRNIFGEKCSGADQWAKAFGYGG